MEKKNLNTRMHPESRGFVKKHLSAELYNAEKHSAGHSVCTVFLKQIENGSKLSF